MIEWLSAWDELKMKIDRKKSTEKWKYKYRNDWMIECIGWTRDENRQKINKIKVRNRNMNTGMIECIVWTRDEDRK